MAYMGFTWQGRNSADYGLALSALPVISMPASRYSVTNIPGRNDTIFKREGFADYTVELSLVYVGEHSDFRYAMNEFFYGNMSVKQWRNKLILPTENNFEYTACLFEEIDFEKFYRYKTTTVKFTVQPLKEYVDNCVADTTNVSQHEIQIPSGKRSTIFGRKPRLFIECDLTNITDSRIVLSIGKITTADFSQGYRYLHIARAPLQVFGNKVVIVLDFESDEYYVCKAPSVFNLTSLYDKCMPENAVSNLVPLLFMNDCFDVDNVNNITYPLNLWKDVTFNTSADEVKMWRLNGETEAELNCKVCDEFRVKVL